MVRLSSERRYDADFFRRSQEGRVEHPERADAARNRKVILEAADELFAASPDPAAVSMDDIAQAAGVGKGTLFRRFGDRTSLLRQVYAVRIARLRSQIESGPPPLGPSTAPDERIEAIIDGIARVKLANLTLMAALEGSTSRATESLFSSPNYKSVHILLTDLITRHKKTTRASWTAHALLGVVRADLLWHLVQVEKMTNRHVRSYIAAFVTSTLASL
jgi:AcrR family transcriptional regulator